MADLVTFLRARLADDEQIARAALNPKRPGDWEWRKDSRTTVTEGGDPIQPSPGVERGPHIARWHPARVLAEVEAKRRILDLHVLAVEPVDMVDPRIPEWSVTCEICGWSSDNPTSACSTLRLLALPFASHPDYDETWRPA